MRAGDQQSHSGKYNYADQEDLQCHHVIYVIIIALLPKHGQSDKPICLSKCYELYNAQFDSLDCSINVFLNVRFFRGATDLHCSVYN